MTIAEAPNDLGGTDRGATELLLKGSISYHRQGLGSVNFHLGTIFFIAALRRRIAAVA